MCNKHRRASKRVGLRLQIQLQAISTHVPSVRRVDSHYPCVFLTFIMEYSDYV